MSLIHVFDRLTATAAKIFQLSVAFILKTKLKQKMEGKPVENENYRSIPHFGFMEPEDSQCIIIITIDRADFCHV